MAEETTSSSWSSYLDTLTKVAKVGTDTYVATQNKGGGNKQKELANQLALTKLQSQSEQAAAESTQKLLKYGLIALAVFALAAIAMFAFKRGR